MFRLQRPFQRSALGASLTSLPSLFNISSLLPGTSRMSSRTRNHVTLAEIPTLREQYKDCPKPKGRSRDFEGGKPIDCQ